MKKTFIFLLLTIFAGSLYAAGGETLRSLYDVVAPVLHGNPAPADRQIGQIYYDAASGGYKGVNKNGGIDILTNAGSSALTPLPKASVYGPSEDDLVFDTNNTAPVIFRQTSYDTNSMYNSTTGLFTVSATGYYTFHSQIEMGWSFLAGDLVSIEVKVNGSGLNNYFVEKRVLVDTNRVPVAITVDLYLQAGDTVGLALYTTTGDLGALSGWATLKQIP